MCDDIPETDKTVVYWENISPEKPIPILFTNSWIKFGGALKEIVGMANMNNVCRLWHIGTDYPFTQSKYRGQVVGSQPTLNVQCNLLEEGNDIYMWQEELYI